MEPRYSMAGRDSQSLRWSVAWDKVSIEHWALSDPATAAPEL